MGRIEVTCLKVKTNLMKAQCRQTTIRSTNLNSHSKYKAYFKLFV